MPVWRSRLQLSRCMVLSVPFARSCRTLPRLVRQYARPSYAEVDAAPTAPPADLGTSGGPRPPTPEPESKPEPEPPRPSSKNHRENKSSMTSFASRLLSAPVRPHPPDLSAVVTPILPSPVMTDLKLNRHRHIKGLGNQLRIQRIRDERNLPDPDWRELLKDLSAMTPERHTWGTVVVEASMETSKRLMSSDDFGVRTIMAKSGCAIATDVRPAETEGGHETMTITIHGPPSRLRSAIDLILITVGKASLKTKSTAVVAAGSHQRRVKDSKASQCYHAPFDVEEVTRHYGPDLKPSSIKPNDPLVVEDIPCPSKWTCDNLDAYIERITNPVLEKQAKRHFSRRGLGRSHSHAVSDILEKILSDPEAMPFVTVTSFHRALRFVTRFQPAFSNCCIRFLWLAARNPKGLVTTETFNILLKTHARLKDLGSFHLLIRIMHSFDCMPNMRTWLMTLRLFESAEIRRYILHTLDQKGMLDSPVIVRQIAAIMLSHDTQLALEQGLNLDQILARHDELYGGREIWLTRKGGLDVIDALCRHGHSKDALKVTELMAAPGRPPCARPDFLTLNRLLTHASTHRLTNFAIDVLAVHTAKYSVEPDDLSYKLLFDLFWKAKMPLTVATVWHCAVLNRKVSKLEPWGRMAYALHVLRKLVSKPPDSTTESDQLQMLTAAAGRLRSLISPFVASLTWYKISEPVEPELGKKTTNQNPCYVETADLIKPGFYDDHRAASIRESESRLAARHAGYVPGPPLYRLLRLASRNDNTAISLLDIYAKGDKAHDTPISESEDENPTMSSPRMALRKRMPEQSLRQKFKIRLKPCGKRIAPEPHKSHLLYSEIEMEADYSPLYWALENDVDKVLEAQGAHSSEQPADAALEKRGAHPSEQSESRPDRQLGFVSNPRAKRIRYIPYKPKGKTSMRQHLQHRGAQNSSRIVACTDNTQRTEIEKKI
ncbi:hypothetical protein MCOR27_009455 [Pyricularia oryzae]|uniref:Pentatricopeptide repeat domain-containing protein n=1 Tax=Pyricularia grisea TaxID=148305 RepID=A0ABQ8NDS7_PYRGI|nr:hypothetical protein MCOR02_002152 [Pyricularia oryzae]KAI6295409.1 hypothetical protein MCOR33_007685 [Pyricularia grisea]KAI6261047.1 hypothetical protein MCOR19_002703 [Pyricularia oryzae]KAI6270101.1 hypothetical protein MCOR27_009455 [Pyricularia oryzae]KAI6332361.1 hypothetical protein MCOR30_004556 [Pyricularia oryzae]